MGEGQGLEGCGRSLAPGRRRGPTPCVKGGLWLSGADGRSRSTGPSLRIQASGVQPLGTNDPFSSFMTVVVVVGLARALQLCA
jgi:hypothetical protein